MEPFLVLLLGVAGLALFTTLSESSDSADPDETAPEDEELILSNTDGQWVLTGTSGPDFISPLLLEQIQLDITENTDTIGAARLEVRAGDGDDTLIAASFGDPDDPDRILAGQDLLTLRGDDGNDLIISEGNIRNVLDGGEGDDTLVAFDLGSTVLGGEGDDLIFARSFFLGEQSELQLIETGPGDNIVRVFNGFAVIESGSGENLFALDFFRPDEQSSEFVPPFEPGFANFGGVDIRDFDPDQDTLAILLPPEDTDNIELESIVQTDASGIFITLSMTQMAPNGVSGEVFSAQIRLFDVEGADQVIVDRSDDGVLILFGQTDGFDPASLPALQPILDQHFPQSA